MSAHKIPACADCKWVDFTKSHYYSYCEGPHIKFHYDVVSGKSTPLDNSCNVQRSDGWLSSRMMGQCGKAGRFFQPKETE
jgi:hypothetical protein